MNKTQRFEHSLPFHTLRVDIFEGNVKRFIHGANFVTLRQLRYAFRHRPQFQKHLPFIRDALFGKNLEEFDDDDPDGSCMTQLITDDILLYKMTQLEAENETESPTFGQIKIDIYKLIILGVILCWGSAQLKSQVLYNCIQTHTQEFIVPNDRMLEVLACIIKFSSVLLVKHACKFAHEPDYQQAELPLKLIDEELIESVREDFLEAVFGTESKMQRKLFLKKILEEENRWILDSELVRQRIKQHLRA